jgi:hypothetical protein
MAGPVAAVRAALDEGGVTYEQTEPGAFFVTLPGTHKLATHCWLVVGAHSLLVEAFVVRKPDAVAFSADANGDVYLVGRLPLGGITTEEVDRILGSVLQYADESFDTLLEIGFASSIRREWAWRQKRGESTANLKAFARFAQPDPEAQQ